MKLVRSVAFAIVLVGGAAAAQAEKQAPDKQAPEKQAPADEQPPADKQAPAEVTPSEARAWVALFDKVVDTVVANREHCDKMAAGLHAIIDANQATIEMARDAKARGKKLPASVHQHMRDSMRRMIAALDKCGRDEKVAGAFKRIDLGNRQGPRNK